MRRWAAFLLAAGCAAPPPPTPDPDVARLEFAIEPFALQVADERITALLAGDGEKARDAEQRLIEAGGSVRATRWTLAALAIRCAQNAGALAELRRRYTDDHPAIAEGRRGLELLGRLLSEMAAGADCEPAMEIARRRSNGAPLPDVGATASLEELWDQANEGSGPAVWALGRRGDEAIAFIRSKLEPPREPPDVERWIADLDSDDYAVRERATAELAALGEAAEQALRRAAGSAPLEVRARAGALLRAVSMPEGRFDIFLRAGRILEAIDTPAARSLLSDIKRRFGEPVWKRLQHRIGEVAPRTTD